MDRKSSSTTRACRCHGEFGFTQADLCKTRPKIRGAWPKNVRPRLDDNRDGANSTTLAASQFRSVRHALRVNDGTSKKSSMSVARRRKNQPPSLLIIQFDAEKLRADGLLLADLATFVGVVTTLASGAVVVTKEATTHQHLCGVLEELASEGHRFDVIAAIGHSNETGVRIARDKFADWDEFAHHIKRFEPRRLVLVACQAGRWPAANVLFKKLPKLRRIIASPVNASKDLATLMLAIVPYLVEVKAPSGNMVLRAQALLTAATGRQVRHWMRKDKDDPAGLLLDFASLKAHPIIQDLRGALLRSIR